MAISMNNENDRFIEKYITDATFEALDTQAFDLVKELCQSNADYTKIIEDQAFDFILMWADKKAYRYSKYLANKAIWYDLRMGRSKHLVEGENYWILPPNELDKPIKAKFTEGLKDSGNFATYDENGKFIKEYLSVVYYLTMDDGELIMNDTPPKVLFTIDDTGRANKVVNTFRK